jgi:hypothetical protein
MPSLVAISPTMQRLLDGSIPPTQASIIITRARVAHDCKPLQAVSDMSITEWRRQGRRRRCWPQRVRQLVFLDERLFATTPHTLSAQPAPNASSIICTNRPPFPPSRPRSQKFPGTPHFEHHSGPSTPCQTLTMASPSSLSATDRVSLSVSFLTQQCVDKFNRQPTKDGPSLENRLADFNLWADGVGALAKPGLSLDSRFRDRPDDLRLVKAILIMLADFLDEYGGSDDHPEEHLRNVDSSIKNLAMLGVAIRRTGRASRNRKADRTFDPGEHQELKRHLECIILLRPVEDTPQSVALDLSAVDTFRPDDSERHELIASELNKLAASRIDGLGESKLSDIQKRVVEANLRRRHRFLLAQKRHRETIFGNSQRGPEAAVSEQGLSAEEAPRAPLRGGLAASPRVGASRGKGQLAPTVAGLSTASTAEGTLRYNPLPRRATTVAKTQITSIAADAEFPRPPPPSPDRRISKCPCCCQSLLSEVFKEPSQWR